LLLAFFMRIQLIISNFWALHKPSVYIIKQRYNEDNHLEKMRSWVDYSLTEEQFAQLVGKCRMYQHLPSEMKRNITPMLFVDQQMGAVVRDFYKDESFCRERNGSINFWRILQVWGRTVSVISPESVCKCFLTYRRN